MTQSNEHNLVFLVQNLHQEINSNHHELLSQLKSHQDKVDAALLAQNERLHQIDDKVQHHEHTFNVMGQAVRWSIPSAGTLGILWAALMSYFQNNNPHK